MSLLQLIPELPLLRRELTELSNRRRTYIVRFLGSIVVLTVVLLLLEQGLNSVNLGAGPPWIVMRGAPAPYNPNRYLGSGGTIFQLIVPTLFRFVEFLMPALICGSISMEKERNTLGTLFVTRLSPITIVFEKLCSRLVPMFTFLLLTFPVLAFVYSLGGVDTILLLSTLWLLFCECLLFACIGLMCSSWFATTVTAFLWSYVLTGLLVLTAELSRIPVLSPFNVWRNQLDGFNGPGGWATTAVAAGFMPPGVPGANPYGDPAWLVFLRAMFGVVVASIPSLLAAGTCLLVARFFLIRRAFVSSSSVLLKLFKRVDAFFMQANNTRLTRGIVLVKDHSSLPLFDPVAWRERTKKSLGKARYLIRILTVVEGPILFICLVTATSMQTSNFESLRGLLFFAWGLASLMLTVKAATLMSSERTRETLDALLSTPMTLKEILTQKIAGARRLMMVLSIPIFTVNFTLLMMHFDAGSVIRNQNYVVLGSIAGYCVLALATAIIMMHQLAWLATLLGLRSTSQTRSVMMSLSVVTAWLLVSVWIASPGGWLHRQLLPDDAGDYVNYFRNRYPYGMGSLPELDPATTQQVVRSGLVLCLLRPDGCIQSAESLLSAATGSRYGDGSVVVMLAADGPLSAFVAALVILTWHAGLLLLFRTIALRLAPWMLNRRDESTQVRPQFSESAWPTAALSEVPG